MPDVLVHNLCVCVVFYRFYYYDYWISPWTTTAKCTQPAAINNTFFATYQGKQNGNNFRFSLDPIVWHTCCVQFECHFNSNKFVAKFE